MNTVVVIEEFKEFDKVMFYTFRFEDSELSETDKFLKRISEDEPEY